MIAKELCNGPQRQGPGGNPLQSLQRAQAEPTPSWRSWGLRQYDLSHKTQAKHITIAVRQRWWAPGQTVPMERMRLPLRTGLSSWPCPTSMCLGTHHSHLHPAGHLSSPVCLLNSKEAETSSRKQSLQALASPRPVAVNMPTYHRQNILLHIINTMYTVQHAFCVIY